MVLHSLMITLAGQMLTHARARHGDSYARLAKGGNGPPEGEPYQHAHAFQSPDQADRAKHPRIRLCRPILVEEDSVIIAGHGRWEAAKLIGLFTIPVIMMPGLSDAKKRALSIADNRIAANAGWDRERLAIELEELTELLVEEDIDISITGFAPVEIEQLKVELEDDSSDPNDEINPDMMKGLQVSQPGDIWILGKHSVR